MKRAGPFIIPTMIEETRYLLAFASARLGCEFDEKFAQVIGCVGRDGKMGGAVIFSDKRAPNIHFNLCCDDPRLMTRDKVTAILGLPFRDKEINRITGWITKGNKRSARLAEGMGFKREGLMRQAHRNGAGILVYGLLRSEYDALYGARPVEQLEDVA